MCECVYVCFSLFDYRFGCKRTMVTSYLHHIAVINGENAAHRSPKFLTMALRSRENILKEMATQNVNPTVTLDSKVAGVSCEWSLSFELLNCLFEKKGLYAFCLCDVDLINTKFFLSLFSRVS